MIDKQKTIAALEAYQAGCKGTVAATVAACVGIIRGMPEDAADKLERLAAYEDTGLEPEEVLEGIKVKNGGVYELPTIFGVPFEEIRDMVEAKRSGRLLALPCKVGDTVYLPDHDRVIEAEVTCIRPFVFQDKIEFRGNAAWRFEDPFHHDGRILEQDVFIVFGKDAYLTREEAEAALKGENNETDSI